MTVPTLRDRASGILLHPTSLPGPHGSGDLGHAARAFVDFLQRAGQRWWQMLPVGPAGYGNSPYSALSAFAGNPLLVSLTTLEQDGLLDARELEADLPKGRVDYGRTNAFRDARLRAAFERFRRRPKGREELEAFRDRTKEWLDDFALYRAIKRAHREAPWIAWEPELRHRDPNALERAARALADEIELVRFEQLLFDRQWSELRAYAAARGVGLIGDLPIFVAHDSADVWARRELFRVDDDGNPEVVAGVPPDYFSRTGQLWGNPLYRWPRMKKSGYAWWIARLRTTLERFDAVRLDHFIGFRRYWEIPAGAPTAEGGRWVKGPGDDFFRAVKAALGDLPLIAEDLGAVTPAVTRLRRRFSLPGIRLLQFAFGTDPQADSFLPHNYTRRSVVYTGTHDNDTSVGWFRDPGGESSQRTPEQAAKERAAAMAYLASDGREIHWDMIRGVSMSVANVAIVPLQDVLGLGTEARMNRPGTAHGNWEWRFDDRALDDGVAERLRRLVVTYGREARREA